MTPRAGSFEEILLLEDNTKGTERDRRSGATRWDEKAPITIRLHRINGTRTTTAAETSYRPEPATSNHRSRVESAGQLLRQAANGAREAVVVAGSDIGGTDAGLAMLCELGLPFVAHTKPGKTVRPIRGRTGPMSVRDLITSRDWRTVRATMPDGETRRFGAKKPGSIALPSGRGKLFAADQSRCSVGADAGRCPRHPASSSNYMLRAAVERAPPPSPRPRPSRPRDYHRSACD